MNWRKPNIGKLIINLILLCLSILWIFPLLFAVLNLFKAPEEFALDGFFSIPQKMNFIENIYYAIEKLDILVPFTSSILYSAFGGGIGIFFSLLAGYGLTHLSIKHKMFWFLLIYSGTIVPFQMYLIPIYKLYTAVKLYDTRLGMLIVYIAIVIPFATFVFRNYFRGISREIVESAKIDGASNWCIFYKLFMPMATSPISVALLFQCSWIWNDLLFGMTFTKSNDIRPVMTTIAALTNISQSVPGVLISCVLVSIPSVILFLYLQKNLEQSIVYTSK